MKDSTVLLIAAGAVVLLSAGGLSVINMGILTPTQIMNLARNAGFNGQALITAVAVALAESSGDPNAHGDLNIGSGSYGLWQINSYWHPEYGPNFDVLYDPQTNANAAYSIYQNAGFSFTPWSTFKTGAYQSFITDAQNA